MFRIGKPGSWVVPTLCTSHPWMMILSQRLVLGRLHPSMLNPSLRMWFLSQTVEILTEDRSRLMSPVSFGTNLVSVAKETGDMYLMPFPLRLRLSCKTNSFTQASIKHTVDPPLSTVFQFCFLWFQLPTVNRGPKILKAKLEK